MFGADGALPHRIITVPAAPAPAIPSRVPPPPPPVFGVASSPLLFPFAAPRPPPPNPPVPGVLGLVL